MESKLLQMPYMLENSCSRVPTPRILVPVLTSRVPVTFSRRTEVEVAVSSSAKEVGLELESAILSFKAGGLLNENSFELKSKVNPDEALFKPVPTASRPPRQKPKIFFYTSENPDPFGDLPRIQVAVYV
ncbi:hypothetical protein CFP56_001055 [Quercus suber]|uniref:Uncharacterized protein n=1 Tax=Quercus suber TaxID=58331 RepID=A0AAW0IP16_QUESU